MSEKKVTLQEVLAYKDAYAPWFDLNENLPFAMLRRNLSMLRRMGSLSGLAFDDLDKLSEKEIRSAIVAYNTPTPLAPKPTRTEQTPHTSAQFFHSMMSKSPYVSEIIPYSSATKKQTTSITLSSDREITTSARSKDEAIHGFRIKEDEAFSSTRHYSKDKKIYGTIIAKNGSFTAEHHGLNNEQKSDIALEMSLQFLLNLPPDKKNVYVSGSPEEAHRLHAAFLLLKKESGTRYADLTIHLPEGIHVTPHEANDEYIQKHLGPIKKTPEQVTQLHQFLKIKPAFQLDMNKILKNPELSSQDKSMIAEYQTYLNEWAHERPTPGTGTEILIAQQHRYIEMTEAVLPILKRTPSLSKEYEALRGLYEGELESNKKMLDDLYENEVEYESKKGELLAQLNESKKGIIESGVDQLKNGLQVLKLSSDTHLSPEQWKTLDQHETLLKDIEKSIKTTPNLSEAQLRSYSSKLLKMAEFMEPMLTPVMKKEGIPFDMKSALESISKSENIPSREHRQDMKRLKQESEHTLECFNRFKKEYRGVKETVDTIDGIDVKNKEQICSLASKAVEFIRKNIPDADEHEEITRLIDELEKHTKVESINKESIAVLNKLIDAATPKLEEHRELLQTLAELKHTTTPKSEATSEVKEAEEAAKRSAMK